MPKEIISVSVQVFTCGRSPKSELRSVRNSMEEKQQKNEVSLLKLFFLFFFIGSFTIGGGFAMIPFIKREMIDKKHWMEDDDFLDNLALAQSLPGPVVINISILTGYRLRGIRGSITSVIGTAAPSFAVILIIALFLWQYRDFYLVQAAFMGIRPAVTALIVYTIFLLGKRVFEDYRSLLQFVLFLSGLIFLNLHPITVIILSAITGILWPLKNNSKKEQTP